MGTPVGWKSSDRGEQVSASEHLRHLEETGALAEAEALFDALDDGVNPLDPVPVDEFLAKVREKR